ncbi:NAD-dependent epimerase/dehydratase family protein [Albidovulum sp.]|uniref:NAD-dependent epimerase/dehydratase family protein n=1 Tax=Albidovulum sp. TaxID=1872424 RepID=UPI0039B936D8
METALAGRRVFVTGATGFIGRRLVAALVQAGAEVGVLTRSRSGLADLPAAVRPVIGGMGDPALLARALGGADVLFNLAYDVRASAAGNLAGFDRLVAVAEAAGVGRIVHLSSIVVYDAWPGADCTEDGPMTRPGGSAYRQAKIAMERRLLAGILPAAILQPTIVYGPGSALWTDGFARALLAGGVVLPDPEGFCNGVFVEDVVQACLKAAVLPDLRQERFVISGPAPFPWSALLRGYAGALGRGEIHPEPVTAILARLGPRPGEAADRPPSAAARVSATLRRLIGHRRFEALVGAAKRRLKAGARLEPDHHLLEEFTGRGTCRIDHARARLGYAPDYDLAAGLAATEAYLRRMAR